MQSGGEPVLVTYGATIPSALAVGPDPTAPAPPADDTTPAVDAGMRWMVDFAAAEAVGMALRMAVPATLLTAGLDSLLVFGADATTAPAAAADAMAALLDAHHYTDGLEFLPLGTPTNNSAERRAGQNASDPGDLLTFASEIVADPTRFDAAANAPRLAAALGLPAAAATAGLGHVAGAPDSHEADQRGMNSALWQSGWGNYLVNQIGFDGTGLTPDAVAWARDHFVTQVRAFGPFAPLRCGRQPGVLPVTSLDLWQPPSANPADFARDGALRQLLVSLREGVWRPHLAGAPRIGLRQSPPDPDADLADVMRADALSAGAQARAVFGRHYLQHLRAFLGEDLQAAGFLAAQDATAAPALARAGIAWRPRLAQAAYADLAWKVSVPDVQAGEVSPQRGLEPNYVAALLAQPTIASLVAARPDPAAPEVATSLLEALLRHALLREYAAAAARIAASAPGASLATLLRDAELVDLVGGSAPTVHWRRQLDSVVAPVTGSATIRAFLEGRSSFDGPALADLGDARRSLAHLQALDSERLQLLLRGTLDLSAHRLDAWITAFATKRLAAMRVAAPVGLRTGAYGWVENLRPATPGRAVPVATPPGETGTIVAAPDDTGFIHAPSATHAAAAALLRNAHLGARQQRAARPPVRDRCVLAPRPRGGPPARRRAPGAAARRAAWLPHRARPARAALRPLHRDAARHRAAGGRQARADHAAAGEHRRQQRGRRPGAAAAVGERRVAGAVPPASARARCRPTWSRSARSWTTSATSSMAWPTR